MSAQKPAIVLVPGSFTRIASYEPVLAGLRAAGFSATGIQLRTAGERISPTPTMYDDAAVVATEIRRLVDGEGRDVVLVAHSYGGIVSCEASKGLGKAVRASEGKPGGIVRIVFVTALAAGEGQGVMDVMGGGSMDSVTVEGEYMVIDPVKNAVAMFSDLPDDVALELAKEMTVHAAASFTHPLTYAAYKDIPVSYLICEEDRIAPLDVQKGFVAMIESEGNPVDQYSIKATHGIPGSQPETVVRVVREAIGDLERR